MVVLSDALVGCGAVQAKSPGPVVTSGSVGSLPPTMTLETADSAQLAIPLQNGFVVPTFERQDRPTLALGGPWRKLRQTCNHALTLTDRRVSLAEIERTAHGWLSEGYDDSHWASINLPAVENRMPPYEDPQGPENYQDGVWYRRMVDIPRSWGAGGVRTRIVFLAANYVLDLWVNGHWVGYHEGGYTPFAFDLTNAVKPGERNLFVVRVDNPPWYERQDIVPGGGTLHDGHYTGDDWWNYTGVIQDVYLEAVPAVSIVRADVVPQNTTGELTVRVVLENVSDHDAPVRLVLTGYHADSGSDAYLTSSQASAIAGKAVPMEVELPLSVVVPAHGHRSVQGTAAVASPLIWTMDHPNLYVLKVELLQSTQQLDVLWTQFGIRTIDTQGPNIRLNGETVFLAGVARHEEWWDTGRTATLARIVDDLQVIRASGARFLRTAHYPNHIDTYVMADRIGLACWEEIPCWQFTGTQFVIQAKRRIADQMWREMIWAGFNRPSILFWSTCNECREFTERGQYIERVTTDRAQHYPDGRLTTQASAANVLLDGYDPTQDLLDVAGWTLYFGIFYGSTYGQPTQDFLRAQIDHRPDQPLMDAEYGYWSDPNDSLVAQQQTVARHDLDVFMRDATLSPTGQLSPGGFLSGCTWFCIFNWYTQVTGIETMGLMHMNRVTTKAAYTVVTRSYQGYASVGDRSANAPAILETTIQDFTSPVGVRVTQGVGGQVVARQVAGTAAGNGGLLQVQATVLPTGIRIGGRGLAVAAGSQAAVTSEDFQLPPGVTTGWTLTTTQTGNPGMVKQSAIWHLPASINVTDATTFQFFVYDTEGNNTVYVTFQDQQGASSGVWTSGSSRRGAWTQLSVPLSSVQGIDWSQLQAVALGEWNAGTYYFSDLSFGIGPSSGPLGTVSFAVAGGSVNLAPLSFLRCMASASSASAALTIGLTDRKGATLTTVVVGHPGTSWTELVVPLVSFAGLDLTDVTDVSIGFDTPGSYQLAKFQGTNAPEYQEPSVLVPT